MTRRLFRQRRLIGGGHIRYMYPPNPYRNYSMEGSSSLTPPISFPSYHRDTMYPHHFVNPMSMNFSTSIGDIDVQTPTQLAGPPPPPWSPPRQASWLPSSHGDFRLCYRTGNISVCNGCRNRFEKKTSVQHQEWRNFTSPTTNLPDSRFRNAY